MEDFKIVLVYDTKMYPMVIPQILSFSTKDAAEEAIEHINKSPLRNIIETVNAATIRRSSVITDIYRLYKIK